MPPPVHYIHIYQRPKQGSAFLNRYPVYNYQHSIANQGWFDTASCDIMATSSTDAQKILNQYLGSYVAIFVDNPLQPIWEGLINRLTFNSGEASYTISLDDMANRVTVVYTGAANAAAETAAVDNTTSQAIYGIKQDQVEFGTDPSVAPATQRTTLQNTQLSQRALPQVSISQAQGQTNVVHLELIGIFHTLEWIKMFTGTNTASVNVVTAITNTIAVAINLNGSTFFNSTDVSKLNANVMTVPSQERGVTCWDRIQRCAEAGDAANYWVAGVNPTDFNTGQRLFYFRVFNSTVGYTTRIADGLRVRNLYGKLVSPWLVVPDIGVRVTDAQLGNLNNLLQGDPSVAYIQSIQYDANSQKVQWFSADNTTARAAFQLVRAFKPLAKNVPNGAPRRVIVT